MKILTRMRLVFLWMGAIPAALFCALVFGYGAYAFVGGVILGVEVSEPPDLGWFLPILFVVIFLGILIFDFAFPCPRCRKQLSRVALAAIWKHGLLYPHQRLWGLLRGRAIECTYCGLIVTPDMEDGDDLSAPAADAAPPPAPKPSEGAAPGGGEAGGRDADETNA